MYWVNNVIHCRLFGGGRNSPYIGAQSVLHGTDEYSLDTRGDLNSERQPHKRPISGCRYQLGQP